MPPPLNPSHWGNSPPIRYSIVTAWPYSNLSRRSCGSIPQQAEQMGSVKYRIRTGLGDWAGGKTPLLALVVWPGIAQMASLGSQSKALAVLLIVFALMDLLPYFDRVQFSPDKLPIGGLLSGFFGGLTGNQGALRAAFLVRAGLTKEAFVGTAAVVSTFVDLTRLSVYAGRFAQADLSAQLGLVIPAVLAGITGSYLGNRLLKKVTLAFVQRFVAAGLLLIALALGLGWV